MEKIEHTLSSIEVAEMVEKEHSKLLRDLRRYEKNFIEAKIGFNEFFVKSEYKDGIGRTLPCYRITKKGCEFIAHKLTGVKGTIFTARYINRFHEMEDILKGQQELELPWFIREFRGDKIMLFRDFKAITGVELFGKYTALDRSDRLIGGLDDNGCGWKCNNEEFKAKYGFDFGDDDCMFYLYLRGIRKAIRAVENDLKDGKKLTAEAKKLILNGAASVEGKQKPAVSIPKHTEPVKQKPIQICITINENEIVQQA